MIICNIFIYNFVSGNTIDTIINQVEPTNTTPVVENSTKPIVNPQKTYYEAKVGCPICSEKFPVSKIEAHADVCLTNSQNPFMMQDKYMNTYSDTDSDIDEYIDAGVPSETKEIKMSVMELINSCTFPNNESICQLTVRRSSAFEDANKYFKRLWNKRKKELQLVVSFVGEAGIDTGGPLREFFSCR